MIVRLVTWFGGGGAGAPLRLGGMGPMAVRKNSKGKKSWAEAARGGAAAFAYVIQKGAK